MPGGVEAHLVFGPTDQFLIEDVVLSYQVGVVGPQGKRLPRRNGEEVLDAIGRGPSDIYERSAGVINRNQIVDVVMKIGRAKPDALFHSRLLEAQIIADARFRFQIGVPEEIEGREVLEQLRQGGSLETGPDAAFEFRVGL